ncbi:MAG: undecaprenyl-diphosphate phosphatase [Bacteroidales bacterium]|nr:undecaprenyl-diphosphate phosphatase [Bacteroidales bacterium]
MNWIEALILGLVQGLTEFLPVSSSGHLEIGKALFGIHSEQSFVFTVLVHGATVLSTIVVFRKEIAKLFCGLFKIEWNQETQFITKIIVSMIPVAIVGLFFKDFVGSLFQSNVAFVGIMLVITATILTLSFYAKSKNKEISFLDSFIIGIAQAVAVLPGISRSGSTIATGLLLGNKKEKIAEFSFLMVIIPILGENFLDLIKGDFVSNTSVGTLPLVVGFIAAFISGLFACKWMVEIVKKGKLIYFAIYCLIIGLLAIFLA